MSKAVLGIGDETVTKTDVYSPFLIALIRHLLCTLNITFANIPPPRVISGFGQKMEKQSFYFDKKMMVLLDD